MSAPRRSSRNPKISTSTSTTKKKNAGMSSFAPPVKPSRNTKADKADEIAKIAAAAAWKIKENEYAKDAMDKIFIIRNKDIADNAGVPLAMMRQSSGCDNQTKNNCTHFCFSRFLAREITKQLNIINCSNRNDVRSVVQEFCSNIKQLEQYSLVHSYALLQTYSRGLLYDIDISYDEYELYPNNRDMVNEFILDMQNLINDPVNHAPGSTTTTIFFTSYYPIFLIMQNQQYNKKYIQMH